MDPVSKGLTMPRFTRIDVSISMKVDNRMIGIMKLFVKAVLIAGVSSHLGWADVPPNVLFITVDDMNADSVGVFGCEVEDITPNLDRLAGQGMRFEYAHVQVPNCTPSRNVFQTGRYPHNK